MPAAVILRGIAAIVEAYLIYWAVVYFIARKWFGFPREWAVPLASGISICGISAAIATGGAIRARPVVPILVSSLVLVFSVVELLILPFVAQGFLSHEPLVAGAWMGLAVKTDGAAVAAGGITDALILAKNAAEGVHYQPGWILGTAAVIKVFIDLFIGVWAFVLGYIWTNHINVTRDADKAKASEIWQRFPKFIIGFVITFVDRALSRARHIRRRCQERSRSGRRGQFTSPHLLRADVLLDRRVVGLQAAVAERFRQARRRVFRQHFRLRDLGRPFDLVDFLPRRQAAAGELNTFKYKRLGSQEK